MNLPITLGTLYLATELIIRVVMLLFVPRNRSTGAAQAWLMLIMFFPLVGLIAYVLIGSPKLPQRRRDFQYRMTQLLERIVSRAEKDPQLAPLFDRDGNPRTAGAIALVERLGGMPAMSGNEIELLPDYEAAIERVIGDIDRAHREVHVLIYIFANDTLGGLVAEALRRAADRGVIVRVLIDAQGSRKWLKRTLKLLLPGVVAHPALPISLREYTRPDLRNHRKIIVIDGEIGYTGSQNIVDADFKKGIVYKELFLRARGPIASQLQAVFLADWYSETDEQLLDPAELGVESLDNIASIDVLGDVTAQILPSGPAYDVDHVPLLLSELLHRAEKRAVLVSPYFIPDDALLRALEGAAYRGVDVHLIVSKTADQFMVSRAQRSYYEEIMRAGVTLHLYNPPYLLHAKHLSIDDDMAVIGSSNADIRSFRLDMEVSMVIYDKSTVAELNKVEENYIANSQIVDYDEWCRRPLFQQLVENTMRLVSPLL